MNYFDTSEILGIMGQAYKGDEKSRDLIKKIEVPFAVSQDYSEMVLVQDKQVNCTDTGLVKIFHAAPKDMNDRKQVADIYKCDEDGKSWYNIPIPFSFVVRELKYCDGIFSFVSDDNRVISGTLLQISRAMLEVLFTLQGVSEKQIESCFLNIPETVVSPPPAKKTVTDNPKIEDNTVGTLTFNELLQQFETTIKNSSYSFKLCINTDSRNKALKLLPSVHHVIKNLEQVDLCARRYASDELLELKNDNWLEEKEELVTKEVFISRMSIDTIEFNDEKDFEIWYSDGDLFWGHSITVYFNKHHEPENAEING